MIKKKYSQIKSNLIRTKNNSLKANSLISIFLKNKKQLPLIPINTENNKENNNNNKDKRSRIILKQKSLNQNTIKNKLSSPNVFQKRKTDISSRDKIYNNIFPLKNNFIKNIPLFKKEKEEINNKKENLNLLSTNSNYYDLNFDSDIYQFSSVMPTTTKKDEFEISEEDKMFDQFSLEKKKKIKKIKLRTKKLKIKKKKIKLFNSFEAPLKKVYKKIPQIINKIESTKKL